MFSCSVGTDGRRIVACYASGWIEVWLWSMDLPSLPTAAIVHALYTGTGTNWNARTHLFARRVSSSHADQSKPAKNSGVGKRAAHEQCSSGGQLLRPE